MAENEGMNKKHDNTPGSKWKALNCRLICAVLAAAVGSAFQHGYNTGVVNAPENLIEEWIYDIQSNRTEQPVEQSDVTVTWSIAVSIFCIGGMLGGLSTAFVADKLGRKGGLLANNLLVLISALMQGLSKYASSYELLILGRLVIGINSGLNAGLVPMYLSEISPVSLRGAMGTVYQLVITLSILLSQILGLEYIFGTADYWPLLLAFTIIPAILQVITLPFCPESPKYLLVTKGKEMEAERALKWFRKSQNVNNDMDNLRQEYEDFKIHAKVNFKELFRSSALRPPLIIAVVVMIAQQLSGINAVIFFSTKIFKMANLSHSNAQIATIAMGAVNVGMTFVSLVLVEKAGRKTLLLIGFMGMMIDSIFLTISLAYVNTDHVAYLSIALVLLFVIMFAIGPGSIPWFLVTELFGQSARPAATSIAVTVNWSANFLVGLAFLPLQELLKGNVFIIFIILLNLFSLFVYKKVPETKNKTPEEVAAMFRQKSYN